MRRDSAHRARGDFEATGQHRADGCQGHIVSNFEVHGPADNLEWTIARVDDHEAHSIGTLDGTNLVDARHDDVVETLADQFDAFDHQAEVAQDLLQLGDGFGKVNELA